MTNTIDRVAEIIQQMSHPAVGSEIAQALADAGLLMPDPPEPDSDGRLWPEHDFNYSHVQSPKFTGTGNVIIARGHSSLVLTSEEALELASLLAAAALEEA